MDPRLRFNSEKRIVPRDSIAIVSIDHLSPTRASTSPTDWHASAGRSLKFAAHPGRTGTFG
jgi:hypothetical protein